MFCKLISSEEKLISTYKSYILAQTATEMLTWIETNISTHFVKHLFRYINIVHKDTNVAEIKKEKRKSIRKQLYKELNQRVKNKKMI